MKKRLIAILTAAILLTSCTADNAHIETPKVSVKTTTAALKSTASEVISNEAAPTNEAIQTEEAIPTEESTPTEEAVPTSESVATEESAPLPESVSVDILCAGDNLIHSPIYKQAAVRAGGNGYDFSYPYQLVKPYIQAADLAILNQETIITDDFAPSNYPTFATPAEMGDEIAELGFDAVSISNNHCLDKGEAGLLSTLEYWRTNHPEIPVYGAYENAADMNNIRTITVNGISFAFLGYMEHTNGLSLPSYSECELVYLSELDTIRQQIKRAKKLYDCVIVSVHFGLEISNSVTPQQYELSQRFADWGADIIIGTQPHTIQTMEYLDKADGGKAFVFYCLGNLLSAQDNRYSMVGMLGKLTVTKDMQTGEISLSEAGAVPIINHYGSRYSDVRVYPFKEYTPQLAAAHGCSGISMEFIQNLIDSNIPSRYLEG